MRGATPALVYLFNLVEKKFDGRLSLLILDEAWLFLRNEIFSQKISEWLKVLRKKNVFVVFATQDVADVEKSPLKTTIIQQCLTKIYLADPSALTAGMINVYRTFGLTDPEIEIIAQSQMKKDYFYTSPIGRRMFQLDLGSLTLALIGAPDHNLLDKLVSEKGFGIPLCREILSLKGINYQAHIGSDAPKEVLQKPKKSVRSFPPESQVFVSSQIIKNGFTASKTPATDILDAAANIQTRSNKGEGRAAESLARYLGISPTTLYQAKKILKFGHPELIEQVRKSEITIKKACKNLKQEDAV